MQLDDAYLGGEKPGKRGSGAANKIPVVIAVQTRADKPIYTQLRCVAGLTNGESKAYAAASIEASSPVATDGLDGFAALTSVGMMHRPIVTSASRPDDPEFKWVNTGLGNIKSAISRICRTVRPRHAARYLSAFEYRFNRGLELDKMVERLATVAAKTTPQPC